MTYVKFRFTSVNGATAGLVISKSRYMTTSISELSRFFPAWEARNMTHLECSPEYETEQGAILHDFDKRGKP